MKKKENVTKPSNGKPQEEEEEEMDEEINGIEGKQRDINLLICSITHDNVCVHVLCIYICIMHVNTLYYNY